MLYYVRSPLRTGGDESDIAVQLGVPRAAIEIPFALAFAVCLVLALRDLNSWPARLKWLGTVLLGSVATGVPMALADNLIISQVDAGHAWVQPLLGYSLPVLLVNGLALVGLGIWLQRQQSRAAQNQGVP